MTDANIENSPVKNDTPENQENRTRYVVKTGKEIRMADGRVFQEGQIVVIDPNSETAKDFLANETIEAVV